ncbi:MAG: thioredoxin domain-containing protein [Planctomycetes bacterium]|nr:thioredoxin domain-containing protein [Planctomycetota bacterium]
MIGHMANHLANESSLYLRQHASNPVDWYPWGEEALARARELDRPIFLSIGYSACHWCHVREHESFEDPETAAILNEHFVSIKVDREERPDLDQIYMSAVQLLTRQGGWPMSMFLTPDLRPFFGGTYFPPDDRYGRPSFRRVLLHVARLWSEQREAIEQQAGQLTEGVQETMRLDSGPGELSEAALGHAAAVLRRSFDSVHGGFGSAPKFPHALELRLLLRVAQRYQDDYARAMARFTLEHMARGGMYDHLGGGFHRYSTDERWLVPHFEKMLYDNALLTPAYVEAYQATGDPFFHTVVEETLAYVLREMTSPEGPFYSTQDADSEGVEGKFFVWSSAEVEQVLGKDDAEFFASVYDVTPDGNWEERNILHRGRSDEQEAKLLRVPIKELRERLQRCRAKLLETRHRRIWPARDEKILTSWNALMIAAFAQGYQVLERPEYLSAAQRAAGFLLSRMRRPDGRLWRTCTAGLEPRFNAYLEDYAFLIDALVTLYEADFDAVWIEMAAGLADVMIDQFWDDADGGFFYTAREHEKLITRAKDPHDGSIPSGNSMAVTALLRLAKLTGRRDLHDRAEKTLQLFAGVLSQSHAAAQMLIALDLYLGPVQEIAVVGNAPDEVAEALRLLRQRFAPRRVLAYKPAATLSSVEKTIPLLAGKQALGDVTTYICRDFTCQAPLIGLAALRNWASQDD